MNAQARKQSWWMSGDQTAARSGDLDRLTVVADGQPQDDGQVRGAGKELHRTVDQADQQAAGMRRLEGIVDAVVFAATGPRRRPQDPLPVRGRNARW